LLLFTLILIINKENKKKLKSRLTFNGLVGICQRSKAKAKEATGTMDSIKAGTLVLYTNDLGMMDKDTWSGVVTRVDHTRRAASGYSWAWVTFDGIVVPDANKQGIQLQAGSDMVNFDKLSVRQPAPDDDIKRALWSAKVAAYDAQQKANAALDRYTKMESYSHFRVGQTVIWHHMVAMGWGPNPDIYMPYIGTIMSLNLSTVSAVVKGVPQKQSGIPMTATTGLAGLQLA